MSISTKEPEIIYPPGLDERSGWEMTAKGYLENVEVRFDDGSRFRVCFYDPVRLAQDLQRMAELGSPYFAEPGLIVIPEVTKDAVRQAVLGAAENDFFDILKPS